MRYAKNACISAFMRGCFWLSSAVQITTGSKRATITRAARERQGAHARRSLAELETLLAPHGLQRIHRSLIVNLERVRALDIRADGEYDVVLVSGQRLRMSRRYRKAVLDRLDSAAGAA
jgi:DNA-binding LytR/AlgR family response regulator